MGGAAGVPVPVAAAAATDAEGALDDVSANDGEIVTASGALRAVS
jgi:hypothetical protein